MATQASPLKLVRAFDGATAEASAPTTFVNFHNVGGDHYGKLKLVADLHTFNSTPTSYIVQVWYQVGDVVIAGPRVSTTTASGPFAELDCGVTPPGTSVAATLISLTGGTSPELTMNLYGFRYNDLD